VLPFSFSVFLFLSSGFSSNSELFDCKINFRNEPAVISTGAAPSRSSWSCSWFVVFASEILFCSSLSESFAQF